MHDRVRYAIEHSLTFRKAVGNRQTSATSFVKHWANKSMLAQLSEETRVSVESLKAWAEENYVQVP